MIPATNSSKRLPPIFTVSIALTILVCFVAIDHFNPQLIDLLFIVMALAAAARAYVLMSRRQRSKHADKALDFQQVASAQVLPYLTWLKENVRGHDASVEAIVRQVQANIKIAGPTRTLGAFLLVGPTGTGKTFLAKLIAQALYPKSEPVVLSMNQYKNPADVFTLLGSAPGTSDQQGTLTRPVAENPYRVVIFDEIEKCHPDIRQCLFEVLDTGKCLEKNSGQIIHFNGCAFFGTCNGGVDALRMVPPQADPALQAALNRKALGEANLFEKAFLSRWDGIFLMDELPAMTVAEVACLELARQWANFGIQVTFASPALLAQTVVKNADFREYGVRQLAFLIRSATESAIGEARNRGFKTVRLDVDPNNGRIRIATDAKRKAA